MDLICARTQIFLIMLLNVQRWIICAYEQVSHRNMSVFCVCTQIFLIMILIVQRWIICAYEQIPRRNMSVFCVRTQKNNSSPLLKINLYAQIIQRWKTLLSKIAIWNFCARTPKTSTSLFRIYVYAQILQCWKTLLSEIIIRNFCACTQKTSTSLLRICVYAQNIQCWKTLLSEIIIRNFCACTQKSSTSLLMICVYEQKIQQMIIVKSSNNQIVDVLRPAQKLQVWNAYIPDILHGQVLEVVSSARYLGWISPVTLAGTLM